MIPASLEKAAHDLQRQSAAMTYWNRKAAAGDGEALRKALVHTRNVTAILRFAQAKGWATDDLAKGFKLAGKRKWKGLDISVETPRGGVRQWKDPHSGQSGLTFMLWDYGYFRAADGVDGDKVDVFVGPDPEDATHVYVVRQLKAPEFRYYDEDKCMVGFPSEASARAAYLQHYNDPRFLGSVDAYVVPEFVKALKATKRAPAPVGGWQSLMVPQQMQDSPLAGRLAELFKQDPPAQEPDTVFHRMDDRQAAADLMAGLSKLFDVLDPWKGETTPDPDGTPLAAMHIPPFAGHIGTPPAPELPVWAEDGSGPSALDVLG